MTDKNVAIDFFNSWKLSGMVDSEFFSEDFTYTGPSPMIDATAWSMNSDEELPMKNVVVLEEITTAALTIILFEGLDPVTLLTYRTAWFFTIEKQKISRLTDVRQNIQGPYAALPTQTRVSDG